MATEERIAETDREFIREFQEAIKNQQLPKPPPELSTVAKSAEQIITRPLFNERNRWSEFLCMELMEPDAKPFVQGNNGAAGYDIHSYDTHIIPARSSLLIGTKIRLHMPLGHKIYGRIASRSGLSVNHGIDVGAGVIDPDYTGEIKVLLRNHSDTPFHIKKGDRIAQMILEKYATIETKVISSIEDIFGKTERGSNGFGSTGR